MPGGGRQIDLRRPHPAFEGIAPGADFYFVHSYVFSCDHEVDVLAQRRGRVEEVQPRIERREVEHAAAAGGEEGLERGIRRGAACEDVRVADERASRFERRVEPLVRIEGEAVGELEVGKVAEVLKKLGFVTFAPYRDFVRASSKDAKIEVLSEQDSARITAFAETIRKTIRAPIAFNDREIFLTASIGLALSDPAAPLTDEIIKDAELAMYHSKRIGGDRIDVYKPAMRARKTDRLTLESELRRAIEREEIERLAKDRDDERSIADVRPDDVAGYRQCHFFAGIGGWIQARDTWESASRSAVVRRWTAGFDGLSNCIGIQAPGVASASSRARAMAASRSRTFRKLISRIRSFFGRSRPVMAQACRFSSSSFAFAVGSNPILVVSTTKDPATPYQWGQLVAEQLDNARLVTYEGVGHTAYGADQPAIEIAGSADDEHQQVFVGVVIHADQILGEELELGFQFRLAERILRIAARVLDGRPALSARGVNRHARHRLRQERGRQSERQGYRRRLLQAHTHSRSILARQ